MRELEMIYPTPALWMECPLGSIADDATADQVGLDEVRVT
jgi:hypothetical protein